MKVISSVIICLALSACATDYASQLSESNFGNRGMHYSEENVDPTLLMNGIYASEKLSGPSIPLGAVCLSDYRCSLQSQFSSSGWSP
jgi:hypothetical protein